MPYQDDGRAVFDLLALNYPRPVVNSPHVLTLNKTVSYSWLLAPCLWEGLMEEPGSLYSCEGQTKEKNY